MLGLNVVYYFCWFPSLTVFVVALWTSFLLRGRFTLFYYFAMFKIHWSESVGGWSLSLNVKSAGLIGSKFLTVESVITGFYIYEETSGGP